MKHNFAYFIASYGKANNIATLELLHKHNANYPIYIVVGQDDPQLKQYKERFTDTLLIFDKNDYINLVDDIGIYAQTHKVCTYSRLAVTDFAKQLGIQYVGYLFDDFQSIQLRYVNAKNQVCSTKVFDIDAMINLYIDLLKSSDNLCLAGPPNSSFYIGVNSSCVDKYSNRYGNMFVYDVNTEFLPFKSSILEDMSIVLYNNAIGKMSICPFGLQVNCRPPKVTGDCYKGMSVSEYYQHLVLISGRAVNIDRPQIPYNSFTPRIISDKYRRQNVKTKSLI